MSAHGPLGYATVTIADLSGCLAVLARYRRIRNDALAWTLLPTPTGMVLQGQDRMALGTARGFVMDTVVAALLGLMETALGYQPPGLRVDLPVDPPWWVTQYARFSPVNICFSPSALAVHITTATLHLPCDAADIPAHVAACCECGTALAQLGERSSAQRVAQWLADAPPGRWQRYATSRSVARCRYEL